MAKGGRRRRQKEESDDDSFEEESEMGTSSCTKVSSKGMSFAEKRDHQRRAAADKRRTKMKCHLCGLSGHVRRECPGIADDGRGESKYTKSKGDAGATALKHEKNEGKKHRQRGQKYSKDDEGGYDYVHYLPPGFEKGANDEVKDTCNRKPEDSDDVKKKHFHFFDAGFAAQESLVYLRSGRGTNKLSMKEAINEYNSTMEEVSETSNFGSSISRTYLSKLKPWTLESSFPFQAKNIFFVLGLGTEFKCDNEEVDSNVTLLTETIQDNELVIALFADLDFTPQTLRDPKQDRDTQIQRLRCTLKAATENNCPIQIRIRPSPQTIPEGEDGKEVEDDPYSEVIRDVCKILLEATSLDQNLKVHFSCWSGTAEHMILLLQTFPNNIWFGFDSTVTFGKATYLQECAFDLPLSKLLLESGSPRTIPSDVTKCWGRKAFCHSGLIPHIANAIAHCKDPSLVDVTAEMVARSASENTLLIYPRIG